jgi:hypothetical protein
MRRRKRFPSQKTRVPLKCWTLRILWTGVGSSIRQWEK